MKTVSTIFGILAVLLSDVMCAVIAFNYCNLVWAGKYAGSGAPAYAAFLYAIPFGVGIAVCTVLAVTFKRKAAQAQKRDRI